MIPADASAFYARNIANLLEIMVEDTDAGLQLKNFEDDEITAAALLKPSD